MQSNVIQCKKIAKRNKATELKVNRSFQFNLTCSLLSPVCTAWTSSASAITLHRIRYNVVWSHRQFSCTISEIIHLLSSFRQKPTIKSKNTHSSATIFLVQCTIVNISVAFVFIYVFIYSVSCVERVCVWICVRLYCTGCEQMRMRRLNLLAIATARKSERASYRESEKENDRNEDGMWKYKKKNVHKQAEK